MRVVHIPSGIMVHCQEGKSQTSNKERAFQILYAKLKQLEEEGLEKKPLINVWSKSELGIARSEFEPITSLKLESLTIG